MKSNDLALKKGGLRKGFMDWELKALVHKRTPGGLTDIWTRNT